MDSASGINGTMGIETGADTKRAEKKPLSFRDLVIQYQDMVFNLCVRLLSKREDAEDCAQEVFLKIFRGLSSFRGESGLKTWIYRITVNTCRNKLKSRAFRTAADSHTPLQIVADESYSPWRDLERNEKKRLLLDAIRKLPFQQRVVVILRDLNSKDYEEISRITGLRLGTVKSKLSRARKSLCEAIQGVWS